MTSSKLILFLNKVKWFGFRKLYWIVRNATTELKESLRDLGLGNSRFKSELIRRRISRKLINDYSGDSGHNLNFKQYFLGFGLIHYSLVRNIRPRNILCIGSRKGFIPAILALACKDNNFGHVDFVDAGYDEGDLGKHWSGVGFWKRNNVEKHFNKIKVSDFITTSVMTTEEFSKKNSTFYDYVYIDGDHSYSGVKLDYSLFWPKLRKNGLMVFHDVYVKNTKNLGNFGVWKLWKEFKGKNKIIFPFPKDSGLGILQKI